jgi:hypothetical protein
MCHAVNCHRIDIQNYKAARRHRSSVIESYCDNSNHRGPVTDAPTEPDRTPASTNTITDTHDDQTHTRRCAAQRNDLSR